MGMKRRFGNNVIWSAAGHWSRETINFGVFLALARLPGPKSYGLMGMAAIAAAIANAFLMDGIALFIVRAREIEAAHLNAIFWIQVILAVLLGCAIAAVGPLFSTFYVEPDLALLMSVMAALPLLVALSSVPSALLQRAMNFRPLTVRSIVAAIVGGIVGIGLAVAGFGVWSLAFMAIAQWFAQCACLWRATEWRPGLHFRRRHMKDVVSFGMNAVAVNLLFVLNLQFPRFLIAGSLGAVSLGYFTMAWRILEVVSLLTLLPVSQVMIPTLAKLQSDTALLKAGLSSTVYLPLAISLPCFVGLLVVTPILVPVLFGSSWNGAVVVIQLFSLSGLLWAVWSAFDAVLVAGGMMAWRTRLAVVSAAILASSLTVTYQWGLAAIAATMVTRDLFLCVACAIVLHRRGLLDWRGLARRIAPFVAAAVSMGALALAWRVAVAPLLSDLGLLASSVMIGIVVYSAAIALLVRAPAATVLRAAFAFVRRRDAANL
jgi:O-antigen/teichoic acid export membrane protein